MRTHLGVAVLIPGAGIGSLPQNEGEILAERQRFAVVMTAAVLRAPPNRRRRASAHARGEP